MEHRIIDRHNLSSDFRPRRALTSPAQLCARNGLNGVALPSPIGWTLKESLMKAVTLAIASTLLLGSAAWAAEGGSSKNTPNTAGSNAAGVSGGQHSPGT